MAITKIGTPELFDFSATNTELQLPTGDTASRPASPSTGEWRFNTTLKYVEFYDGSEWRQIDTEAIPAPAEPGTDNFNTVLYVGNGSTKVVTTVGFGVGLVWIKSLNGTGSSGGYNALFDIIRGPYKQNNTNLTRAEYNSSPYGVTTFGTDGFTVADNSEGGNSVNGGVGGTYSGTPPDYVSWNWKAGGAATTIAAGTEGNSIASDVSTNVAGGFSIVNYTGNNTTGATVSHNLGGVPDLIVWKANQNAGWKVFCSQFPTPTSQIMELYTTEGLSTNTTFINLTLPTDKLITLGAYGDTNPNNVSTSVYCWRSIPGYSKIGTYTAAGGTTFDIALGFKPAWIMFKSQVSTGNSAWIIFDNKRNPSNPRTCEIFPNSDVVQSCTTGTSPNYRGINFTSTGVELLPNSYVNNLTNNFIYMAFAE